MTSDKVGDKVQLKSGGIVIDVTGVGFFEEDLTSGVRILAEANRKERTILPNR
jgi:hypothetical protein